MPSLWYVNLTLDEATNERVSFNRIGKTSSNPDIFLNVLNAAFETIPVESKNTVLQIVLLAHGLL